MRANTDWLRDCRWGVFLHYLSPDKLTAEEWNRWVDGAQYHVLSYLGSNWCHGDRPRFPDQFVRGYTRHVNEKEGVVTWDVPIDPKGRVPEAFLNQLRFLK